MMIIDKEREENLKEAERYYRLRMQDITDALGVSDDEQREAKEQELAEGVLSLSATIVIKIELSTGGGADGFEIECDPNTGGPLRGRHYYAHWLFYEERPLDENELEKVCQAYGIFDAREFIPR